MKLKLTVATTLLLMLLLVGANTASAGNADADNTGTSTDNAVAAITNSGSTASYTSLEDAVAAANSAKSGVTIELLSDATLTGSGIKLKSDAKILVPFGKTLKLEENSVFTGVIEGPDSNCLTANGMKAGEGGISITGGSLSIDGKILADGTTTDGATVTVSGKDITISGELDGGAKLVVSKDTATNVVFKDFEQKDGTKVDFEIADSTTTYDPAKAAANVSLGNNVALTAVPYTVGEVTDTFVYTGAALCPEIFPGITAKDGYTISTITLLEDGNKCVEKVTASGKEVLHIKSQTEAGTYVLHYQIVGTNNSTKDLFAYDVKRSWSITPMDVTITTENVTKTYDGKINFNKSVVKLSSDKISTVSVNAESKDVGKDKDLYLVVSSGKVSISNFRFIYNGSALATEAVEGGYKVLLPGAAEITAKSVTGCIWSQGALTYNGSERTVEIVGKDGQTGLAEGTDYTIEGIKQTKAGIYKATVTGKGNYTGTTDVKWTIDQKPLVSSMATLTDTLVYTGSELTAIITVADTGLTADDYTITKNKATKAGTYKATVTAQANGNYSGSFEVEWKIAQKPLEEKMAKLTDTLVYTGSELTALITVADTGLTADDYTITNNKATNAGKYTATVAAQKNGNYSGSFTVEWNIAQKPLEKNMSALTDTLAYTGSELTALITVADGNALKQTDYTISNNKATNAGKYTATVAAQKNGNYSGSFTVEWNIAQKELTKGMAVVGSRTYNGSSQAAPITVADGNALKETDYTISNDKYTNAGKYTATVTAQKNGNYSGSFTVDWTIAPKELKNITKPVASSHVYNGSSQNVSITVTDGAALTENDYTLSGVLTGKDAKTYAATVTGKGNYTGTLTVDWTIAPKALKDIKAPVPSKHEYNKSLQTVSITVTDGAALVVGVDYTLGGVLTGTNAGTYTATVIAKENGNYTGTIEVKWTIAPKSLTWNMIKVGEPQTYTGSRLTASITVTDGNVLTSDDYTLGGTFKATNAGEHKATVTGKGNYTGTLADIPWKITPKSLINADIKIDNPSLVNRGLGWTVSASVLDGKIELSLSDYSFSGLTGKGNDTYDFTIIGEGNYKDSKAMSGVKITKSIKLNGAGFYQDAEHARLGMQALGSTYALDVDENTMFIVYEQAGYSESKLKGVVYYYNGSYSKESLYDDDGIRTWLFSDDQVKFVDGGIYIIAIYEGDILRLTTEVSVAIEDCFTVEFQDKDGFPLGYDKVTEGNSVALPAAPSVEGMEFRGWKIVCAECDAEYCAEYDAEYDWIVATYGYFKPEMDVVLRAVYDSVYVPEHSLDYYVIDALNYDYEDGYTYNGKLVADAWGVVEYIGESNLGTGLMNDFARYMGALYRCADGEVSSIYFNGVKYRWCDSETGLKGSNWTVDGDEVVPETNTLVSAVTKYVLANKDATQIVMEISNGVERQSFTYGIVAYDDSLPQFVRLTGAGFYQDADQARLAMQALGSTYALGVDENTMFIVYEQFGYSGSEMKGVVTYDGREIFTEVLSDRDGIRTWLFSDANQVKEKFVNGGEYVITVSAGNDVLFSTTVHVTIEEPVKYFTVNFMNGEDRLGSMTVAEGNSVALPAVPFVGGMDFKGWKIGGDVVATYGYYMPTGNVTLAAYYEKVAEPKTYTVTLDGYGFVTVMAGETIALPTVSKLGMTFIGWSDDAKATSGTQGFYAPDKDVTLYAVFAAAESYAISTDYKGDDVTLAFNSSIAKGSFGLLVVTPKANVIYDVSLTGASLAALGDGSYMIFNVTGDVVITVATETLKPTGFQTFSVVGALADNTGFRVEMTSVDKGGLYGGTVALTYTYCKVVDGKETYFAATSDPVKVEEGVVAWRRDYTISEGTMYYAYAVYAYADGSEQSLTAQTLGVVAPSIPAATAS